MFATELNSFVQKFHQLWTNGLTAHLDIDSHAGNAWVWLRVQLGPVPGPAQQQHVPQHQPRYRGPSYQRRQERRRAAFTAPNTLSNTEQVNDKKEESNSINDNSDAEKADIEEQREVNLTEEVLKSSEQVTKNISTEKVGDTFNCMLCDFESTWKNGLEVHLSRKHKDIEQLDGGGCYDNVIIEDEKYTDTENYWKTGKLSTTFQSFLDANEIIEKSELTEEEKAIEKTKVLEARKFAFGADYIYVPPWKSR